MSYQIYMPLINNTIPQPKIAPEGATVPFGYAIWGIGHETHHAKLAAGHPVQSWSPPECCFTYPTFYPALWGTRYWTPTERVRELAAANPGRTWLLWNEPEPELWADHPDRYRTAVQACISVTNARDITIEWVEAIRASGGKIAGWGCNIVGSDHYADGAWRDWMAAAIRLDYPQPDYWHIHIYADTIDAWREQYEEYQDWNLHVGGNLQTIISEAGQGEQVFRYLQSWSDPRVEAVCWFTRFNAGEDPYLMGAM